MPVFYSGRVGIWRCCFLYGDVVFFMEMLFFLWSKENWIARRKFLEANRETNNKRNPHMTPGRKRTRDTLVGGENSHHCTIPAPNDNMGSGWFLDLLATLCRKPLWSIILSDLFHNSKFYWRPLCKVHAVCYRWNNFTLVQYPCFLLVLRLTRRRDCLISNCSIRRQQ